MALRPTANILGALHWGHQPQNLLRETIRRYDKESLRWAKIILQRRARIITGSLLATKA